MHSDKLCKFDRRSNTATYIVTASDVSLLGARAGVAMNIAIAEEWLQENWGRIEQAIDQFIKTEIAKS